MGRVGLAVIVSTQTTLYIDELRWGTGPGGAAGSCTAQSRAATVTRLERSKISVKSLYSTTLRGALTVVAYQSGGAGPTGRRVLPTLHVHRYAAISRHRYWSSRSRPWWPAKNLSHSARVSSASSDEEIEGIVRSAAPPPAAPPAAAPLPPSCVAAHQRAVPSLSSSGICSCLG